jgi:hypothetical protein
LISNVIEICAYLYSSGKVVSYVNIGLIVHSYLC